MDYDQLPAVLLAAEFHQRYISAIFKASHGVGKDKLRAAMWTMYHDLYRHRSALFEPLWQISEVVFRAAGLARA